MCSNKFTVLFYEQENGTVPVRDFILSLDDKLKSKTLRSIQLLQETGAALRETYSKNLKDGIFELRAKVGTNLTRVLFFFFLL